MSEPHELSGPAQAGPGRLRYTISSDDPGVLADVARELSHDPEVRVLRMLGGQDAPSLVVVETSDAYAQVLRGRLEPRATVQRDHPLELM